MSLTELKSKLTLIYLNGQSYNATAVAILDNLEKGRVEAAAIEFVRDSDKIPTWCTWGKEFKDLILKHRDLLNV